MENKFMNGLKTILFAVVIFTFILVIAPKNTKAATPKMDRTKVTCTAKENFTLKVKNAGGKKVTWSSTKKSVATVSKKGVVVTKKAGKATIKAKVGSKTVKCKVTVKKSAKQPWRVVTNKTLHVGESFLLIEGWFTDYQSTFSFNDRIATVDEAGRVVAKGVGTVKILVNRGKVGNEYRDYFCTVTVVPGAATACKHNWMDARDKRGSLISIKNYEEMGYIECITCGSKFFDETDLFTHRESTGHAGSRTAGGGKNSDVGKFEYIGQNMTYCRNCGLTK